MLLLLALPQALYRPEQHVDNGVVNTNSKFSCVRHMIVFATTGLSDNLLATNRTSYCSYIHEKCYCINLLGVVLFCCSEAASSV